MLSEEITLKGPPPHFPGFCWLELESQQETFVPITGSWQSKKIFLRAGVVVHTCNTSYSGGRDRRIEV
jgi:hypothetical protein